ncbi:family 2 encapsulin nanocompartment cargo protein terpene cyclase [Nonomuraea candida]|uniref:family 2 encapsulin nanocompartment cargo protein terpene cyclase n=1 Tax=Nonomuraea candida TaxID=359159 RepID=UPI0005BBFCBA|nr:family 2 encapsulin nanocompartment cargo protein terpene cyclase [Nonomuraea candida]
MPDFAPFDPATLPVPAGPTGLGAHTLSLRSALRPGRPRFEEGDGHEPGPGPATPSSAHSLAPLAYREREWGDGTYPPLYCPETARVDEALGAEVDRRLVAWAERVGIHAGRMEEFAATGFGRLAMLAHADTDDPDLLLIAAQLNAAWWAADDYYADETDLGATPTELPPRLALVMSAMDPPPDAGGYTAQLEEHIRNDPVLVSLRSATSHAARHSTPAQVMRICNITSQMYVSWAAYAAWRYLETPPPVWRYLAARQHDSFYTSMTLIDIVGGYALPPDLFAERRFHTALMQAGTASVLVNDLHSVAREAADELPDSNVILLMAAEDGCSTREATERAVHLHNHFVRGFEQSQRALSALPSPELKRFLRGAQAWMAGGLEWHGSTSRYQS